MFVAGWFEKEIYSSFLWFHFRNVDLKHFLLHPAFGTCCRIKVYSMAVWLCETINEAIFQIVHWNLIQTQASVVLPIVHSPAGKV